MQLRGAICDYLGARDGFAFADKEARNNTNNFEMWVLVFQLSV